MRPQHWSFVLAMSLFVGALSPALVAQASDDRLKLSQPSVSTSASNAEQGYIPLRQAAESIGAYVEWDVMTQSVKVTYGDRVWKLTKKQLESQLNDSTYTLHQPITMINFQDRPVLAVTWKDLSEALEVSGEWRGDRIIADAKDYKTMAGQFTYALRKAMLKTPVPTENWEMLSASFTPELQKALPQTSITPLVEQLRSLFGVPSRLASVEVKDVGTSVHVNALIKTTKEGFMQAELRVKDGQIADIYFPVVASAGYQAPSYDKADQYKEEAIVIGEGQFALPGTLTIPTKGEGPFPVVVLVHGSGQNDRDESIGAGKPFRDLAVGLAQEGVATIRYEKITREYPFTSSSNPKFTVNEETTYDAIKALQWAKQDKRIDAKQLYVLGHSQGGMLVPRIIEQDKAGLIKGAIVAAAPAGPLEDLMLKQMEAQLERGKQANLPEATIAQLEAQVTQMKQMLTLIKNKEVSIDNLPADYPLPNAAWWMDFRNYYGGEVAKDQKTPLFVIQGSNDVQVGKENLDGWKEALANRTNVDYKLYDKLNHLFIASEKPSTGEEYYVPGNVPLEVVKDIAAWVGKTK
ncbi:alpha/beta fold hydrolase [Paenibacillus sp. 1001270B_150601_E10]|uniref:alpha/beta hydrolase family protein n=1 Tax=Paenibacillus sp. 1001270B_150601_E10 TaxID=2787079 RepID=UPI0018A05283|nr:alpha/beta fold hydrolase [Paenibacillus sp. 1001270B_150601_E10]